MPHAVSLISTLAVGFGLALVLGFAAARLGLPALLGYLLAGVVIGPATPGFVADADIAGQLAEIGVMLLMFGVGLHFSLADLLSVRRIALPGAIVQMVAATALGAGAATWWGWPLGASIVFGLTLSVASTVVLLKALEARGALESGPGRVAIGWLVVEDLAMVLVLVVLPPLSGALGGKASDETTSLTWTLGKTLLEVAAFVALMLVVGRRAFPWVLWQVTKTGSRELFTLAVVVAAVTIAYASSMLFGVSFALGAFFAGMVLRESEFSHRAAEETLPLRDAFAVLFFVSVGMLFDPLVLIERPLQVLGVVGIIVVGKSLAAAALVIALGYPLRTALIVSVSLAQIGEFSFILGALAMSLGLLPAEGRSLIVGGALISIALNPLLFKWAFQLGERLDTAQPAWLARLHRSEDPLAELPSTTHERYLSRQVVIVGYGRVGKRIAESLATAGIPYVVADENRELVERLRQAGTPAVFGNATDPATLIQAHIANARVLVIATPDTIEVRQMAQTARTLNPSIEIAVRSHNSQEAALLRAEGTGRIFVGETELALAMARYVEDTVSQAPA